MRTIETVVYRYDELSDKAKQRAKQRAREWYLEDGLSYDWWDACYEDFVRVGEILGIEFSTRRGGKTPEIYFNGFYSQGSGSAFDGTYRYAKGAVAKIKTYSPEDEELHRIAQALQDIQQQHFYRLGAQISSYRDSSISVDVYDREDRWKDIGDAERDIKDLMNDFNHWMYCRLRDECEYLTSDEVVEESIVANEYEFDEEGNWI